MSTSKHRAVHEWLQGCHGIAKLFFSFGTESDGATIIVPSDRLLTEYSSGMQEREYTVQLSRFLPLSFSAADTINIDMLEDVDTIAEWIVQQEEDHNYPIFPANCRINSIEVMDGVTEIAQNGLFARYILPFTINYIKE